MAIYVLRYDHLIKIGFSDQLAIRIRTIMATTPAPVFFVGWMPGGRDLEAHLHERFAPNHFSGEWFIETEEVRQVFSAILDPCMPESPASRPEEMRKLSGEGVRKWSGALRSFAAREWPEMRHRERIKALSQRLGWTQSRVRDLYYSDRRIALRAVEERELALLIAPELRSDQ